MGSPSSGLGSPTKAGFPASYHLIYKAEFVCLSVCLRYARVLFAPSPSNSLWLLGALGIIAGLTAPVLRFTESYPSISAFSFAGDCHFLIIVQVTSGFY